MSVGALSDARRGAQAYSDSTVWHLGRVHESTGSGFGRPQGAPQRRPCRQIRVCSREAVKFGR